MAFPVDNFIFISYLNTKLRDEYDSLQSLCEDLDEDVEATNARLAALGYHYDEAQNRVCG